MSNDCQNCAKLQAENIALKEQVLRLQRVIQEVKAYCFKTLNEVDKVLSGSNPKGVWAFNRGKKEGIEPVANYLSD